MEEHPKLQSVPVAALVRQLLEPIFRKLSLRKILAMSELHHECGVAAIYHLSGHGRSPMCTEHGPRQISRLLPRMLLDIQNRGQLAAGMTVYDPECPQLLKTL